MTTKLDWSSHCDTREECPSKHPWGDPSDMCLIVQKKIIEINNRLLTTKQTKHTYAPDGCIPLPKDR